MAKKTKFLTKWKVPQVTSCIDLSFASLLVKICTGTQDYHLPICTDLYTRLCSVKANADQKKWITQMNWK